VTLSYPFAIGKFEVTFTEWEACVAAGGCDQIADDGGFGRGERPAVNISWDDAKRYLDWLSKLTGKTYRLPSEAEWEYAARAGSTTLYSFGDDAAKLGDYAWYIDNAGSQTHPVGKKKSNDFGVYDAHGNAGEWVEDPWHDWYADAPSDGSVWTKDGDSTSRIVRGGSMYQPHWGLYSMRRAATEPKGELYTGFRAVRSLNR
jgi:formylglycine-generating enzyme required for sulfatase activity